MNILIVGEKRFHIYEEAICNGFKCLGLNCEIFSSYKYLKSTDLITRLQNKFLFGPKINKLNKDLLHKTNTFKPDLIFFYRPTMIFPKTIKKLKTTSACKLFAYHNDDPFGKNHPFYLNRHFISSLKYFDWIFSYRQKNLIDYKKRGFTNTSLLRSYFLKQNNFYIPNIKKEYDLIFIGHFEDDGRDEYINFLLENKINVKLYGTYWNRSKYYSYFKEILGDINPVFGEEYNTEINKSKMALVFLSKLNNDTYTRRCFEIPITKTIMVSEYTDDLNSMFEENKEALYFRNKEELINNIQKVINNDEFYNYISNSGYKKIKQTGHEVTDRANEIIKTYKNLIGESH